MAENDIINEGYLARFFARDSDTLFTWSNTGLMMFKPYHEWGDSFDPATGETGRITGERYDADTDSFEPVCTAGTPVFNGRLSGLWDCVEQAWPEDIAAMYRSMRANGFNAESLWEMYQSFRTQWCEALYAADAMGYANTGRFDMAYGDKSEAMRYILKARFRYLDSKYGANTSAPLEFRLWGNGKGVALRYYCPLYASLNWGAGGILTERAITPGEPSHFPNPGTTFNETTFTIYNADLLTEITTYTELPDGTRVEGGLQDLATRCTVSGLANCKRLKSLELDYSGREANTNLDNRVLDACRSVALRKITVRNCPNVSGHADFASQVIEEIDFRGTAVAGVGVPETDTLRSVALGSGVREVRFANMHGLESLSLEGTDNLAAISIHDCPKLNIRALLNEALQGDTLREVTVSGVKWLEFSAKHLEKLADMGATITGEITLGSKEQMSFALKQKCLAAWGNIDSPENPLRINYASRPVEIIRISGAGYFGEPGDYQLKAVSEDPYANDFTAIEWSMAANGYAEIDTLTGRVRVSRVGTEELAPTAEVTVTVHKSDGTSVSKTTTVGFYDRSAKVGDYVYADGSFSDVYDDSRTVVAICFYIDPNDPTLRLGVAPRSIGSYAWGLAKTYQVSNEKVKLTDDPEYNVYDIKDLTNYFTSAMRSCPNADTDILDAATGDALGFKVYDKNAVQSRIGFETLSKDLGIYSEGDVIPCGMADTLRIIAHRNKILRDSGINLEVPVAAGNVSEKANLDALIVHAQTVVTYGQHYYYPAASYAYAYQPTIKAGETLSEKFKTHKWFLPAPGDGLRLSFYMRHASVEGSEYRIFDKAMENDIFTMPERVPTAGEGYPANSAIAEARITGLYADIANIYTQSKAYALPVRPMVQF